VDLLVLTSLDQLMFIDLLFTSFCKTRCLNEEVNCTAQGRHYSRNTKGGSITVLLTSYLTGLESAV
jgi:hypothetical protein